MKNGGAAALVVGLTAGIAVAALFYGAFFASVGLLEMFTCRPEGWSFRLAWFGVPLAILGLVLVIRSRSPFWRGAVIGSVAPVSVLLILNEFGSSSCP